LRTELENLPVEGANVTLDSMKVIATNKKAFHDYEILDRMEAGIVLSGDEVKAIRLGTISLNGAFATLHGGELYLINCNITPYEKAYQKTSDDPTKRRKLLLHRKELNRLIGLVAQKGITLIPLKVYLNEKSLIKVEIGMAKHKKAESKKRELREKDINRQTERELRGRD